ncbi:aldo/keto reductase [Aureimonas fodinaquatilis]|uniref:Aldo/keto reductase n=1 Tax=Aureimonas fodinaquatilis TaxID=2565783 RepID=A0A5B0DTU1_9HYPH|nr:aldo/keto reductase [Aureimonas fodinaquatilis]KAA0969402.1 aldo/keto reductase [Aureimonas fodinaquatilis]
MNVTDRRPLPRADLQLSVLGIGGAQIGGLYRAMSDANAAAIVDAAWQAGIRYFDTAPFYGFTRSEHRMGNALRKEARNEFALSTKVGRMMRPNASVGEFEQGYCEPLPFRPEYDYRYDAIIRSHEDSLQRLGLPSIDMLYVHDIGSMTHGERHAHYWEQLTKGGGFRALEELRRSGLVKSVGLGVNEWQVVDAAMNEMDLDCTMLAGRYTLLEQDSLALLNRAAKAGHAIVAAAPFNSGLLVGNGKFNYDEAPEDVLKRAETLNALAQQFDVPLPAAAIQFGLAHPAVVSIVTGTNTPERIASSVAWFETPVPAEFWQALATQGLVAEGTPLPGLN